MKRKEQMIQQSTSDQHQILLLIFNLLWTWKHKMPPSQLCDLLRIIKKLRQTWKRSREGQQTWQQSRRKKIQLDLSPSSFSRPTTEMWLIVTATFVRHLKKKNLDFYHARWQVFLFNSRAHTTSLIATKSVYWCD